TRRPSALRVKCAAPTSFTYIEKTSIVCFRDMLQVLWNVLDERGEPPQRGFPPSEWKWQRRRFGPRFGWDFLFGLEKVPNITTAEVRPFEAKGFATNQRDRLGFNLADVPCGLFAIHNFSDVVCPRPMALVLPS